MWLGHFSFCKCDLCGLGKTSPKVLAQEYVGNQQLDISRGKKRTSKDLPNYF